MVIVIMAVVSSVVVPAFANMYERSRFDSECVNAQAIFSWAHQQAVERDTTVVMHFDAPTQAFTATLTPPPPPNDQPSALASQTLSDTGLPITKTFQLNPEFRISNLQVDSGASASSTGRSLSASQGTTGDIVFQGDGTVNSADFEVTSRIGAKHFVLSPATGMLKAVPDGRGFGP